MTQLMDAEIVIYRLEEAGKTLLSLPVGTPGPASFRSAMPQPVQDAAESYGWQPHTIRPPVPGSTSISRMDEVFRWLALIPGDRYVLRRIVGARSLVSPVTERHLFSWTRIAAVIGADRKAVQRWHAQGIDIMVAAINAPEFVKGLDRRGRKMREEFPKMAGGANAPRPVSIVGG